MGKSDFVNRGTRGSGCGFPLVILPNKIIFSSFIYKIQLSNSSRIGKLVNLVDNNIFVLNL